MNYVFLWNIENQKFIPILGESVLCYMLSAFRGIPAYKYICTYDKTKDPKLEVDVKYLDLEGISQTLLDIIDVLGYSVFISKNMPLLEESVVCEIIQTHCKQNNKITIVKSKNKGDKIGSFICIKNSYLKQILEKNEFIHFDSLLNKIFKDKKLKTLYIKETIYFQSVTSSQDIIYVEEVLRKRIINQHIQNMVFIENENTITIGPRVRIERQAVIRQGSIILGDSFIDRSVIVGPYSELVNVYMKEYSKIIHSVAYDSTIGVGASVGPFAHLRMHSIVGDEDRIGNFVELKNTCLGRKTNVSHLTYLGDTICGNGVNFGCGVVTVNYDGKIKHKTEIGNNVFIGCNSNLIAPIQIADHCYIAAGSTITKSLKENDFAIARAPQITKEGYALKYGYKKV